MLWIYVLALLCYGLYICTLCEEVATSRRVRPRNPRSYVAKRPLFHEELPLLELIPDVRGCGEERQLL